MEDIQKQGRSQVGEQTYIGQEEFYFEDLGMGKENMMADGVGESQA